VSVSSQLLRLPADEAVRRLILDRCGSFRHASERPEDGARLDDARRALELTLSHLASRFCECALIGRPLDARGIGALEEAASMFSLDLRGRANVPSFGAAVAGILRMLGASAIAEVEAAGGSGPSWGEVVAFAGLADERAGESLAFVAPRAGDELSIERARRAVEQVARALEVETEVETEQKFLLRALPPRAREGTSMHLVQGYLPGQRLHERLRRVEVEGAIEWLRTVKLGTGLQRVEIEEETTEQVFEQMWPLTAGRRIDKIRYEVEDGGYLWIIDQFLDRDLVLAEVELPALGLIPAIPEWLAPYLVRDVTSDPRYVNVNLAS
jgi:CYTH domain-containing protein